MTSTGADPGTAAGIIRLGTAFCDAKALLTAVRLDLFTVLAQNPATAGELRTLLRLHGRGLPEFLALLAARGLLRRDVDGRYHNAEGADRHLVAGRPGAVTGFLIGADINLYDVYGRLGEALRTGKPQADGDFAGMLQDPVAVDRFARMMDGLTEGFGAKLLDALDGTRFRTVLDVGGCRGHLTGQLLAARDDLVGHVFDLPQMEPVFDEHMAELGLTERAHFHAGDFFRDPLPPADVIIFGHNLSDWDPDQRRLLLTKAYTALSPGGTVLVYDRMLGERRDDTENLVASLNMLLVTEGGREYTVAELGAQARATGFSSITHRPLADHDTLVSCRKD
ncbi:methyltransferase [Streptomyces sp. SID13666]|uniref:methyltransferase n=1 Tax=unclassified Streptomyces TaxID=2593676 RepID=UPI001107018F|nr:MULTISPECIES: methyltransferase [unclassified Streptomyces]MCZ4097852.1 methyltransferase [Streptomyces sp. H39-C1]NEA57519.1 methyltransferase [Streptomyces sp. SID13666]NEA70977.1 methyltransferase [Streptomyces sp. SID13588]QNA76741.1 methyltransferase [Streptomyces sp. So13.3]